MSSLCVVPVDHRESAFTLHQLPSRFAPSCIKQNYGDSQQQIGGECKKEEARTGWCYRCVDGSIGGWGGSASALWRAFASYERTCGTACALVSSGSGIRKISTARLQAWWGFKEDALSSLSLRRVVVTLGGIRCVKRYTRLTGT